MFLRFDPAHIRVPDNRIPVEHMNHDSVLRTMTFDFLTDNEHDKNDVEHDQTVDDVLKIHVDGTGAGGFVFSVVATVSKIVLIDVFGCEFE